MTTNYTFDVLNVLDIEQPHESTRIDTVDDYYKTGFPFESLARLSFIRSGRNLTPHFKELMLWVTPQYGNKWCTRSLYQNHTMDIQIRDMLSKINNKNMSAKMMYSLHECSSHNAFMIDLDDIPFEDYVSSVDRWKIMKSYAVYITHWFISNYQGLLNNDDFIYYHSGNRGIHIEITHPMFTQMPLNERKNLCRCFAEIISSHVDSLPLLRSMFRNYIVKKCTQHQLRWLFNMSNIYIHGQRDVYFEENAYTAVKRFFDDYIVKDFDEANDNIIDMMLRNHLWTSTQMLKFVFRLVGPVLDQAVTCQNRHMVRLPFSVHEKTGNIKRPFLSLEHLMDCEFPAVHHQDKYMIQCVVEDFDKVLSK